MDNQWLIGYGFDSPEVQKAVAGWKALEWLDEEDLRTALTDRRLSLINEKVGLYIFFTSDECFARLYGRRKSMGRLVVARMVFLVDYGNGFGQFKGQLPFGLSASDDFRLISQRLGAPRKVWVVEALPCKARWLIDDSVIDVSFDAASGLIKSVSVTPNAVVDMSTSAPIQLPAPERFVELFGASLSTLRAMAEMRAFNLSDFDRGAEIGHYGEADYSAEFGVELYFKPGGDIDRDIYPGPKTSEPCLSGLRYRVDLDFHSTGYKGSLPGDLDFDDPVPVVMDKLGTPPATESFDGRDGYQRWHLARTDLHVLYSQLEDRIYRVTLLAHGCYE